MKYGSITTIDIRILESAISNYRGGKMRFLEIGVHSGETARGVLDYCNANQISIEYWGIDPNKPEGLFSGANFVQGDSAESFHLIPDELDVVMVDGCHCINHVMLDIIHYQKKVVPGGFMLFHDTGPHLQQTMKDPHGPNIPEFHNSVNAAMELIRFPWSQWSHYASEFDPASTIGGMACYRKTI
jgi:hypothetical protein